MTMHRGDRTISDEWFSDFIETLEASVVRRRRLYREVVVIPAADQIAADYQDKTEQLRRMIAVERGRWLAEHQTTPLRAA